jgi:hypothetical protein
LVRAFEGCGRPDSRAGAGYEDLGKDTFFAESRHDDIRFHVLPNLFVRESFTMVCVKRSPGNDLFPFIFPHNAETHIFRQFRILGNQKADICVEGVCNFNEGRKRGALSEFSILETYPFVKPLSLAKRSTDIFLLVRNFLIYLASHMFVRKVLKKFWSLPEAFIGSQNVPEGCLPILVLLQAVVGRLTVRDRL